ncbi:class I SAM-dependent methyltransferase [Kribbella italica]|uniref:Ubiquinone/menaquinone biosynthesis C-methylase UbiE n=1 Tax=Kribbella italica TaxID=1540520 RepID=A0A7W9JEN5_9ACTN|nr:class I SAM-dependent methyltransferase [Kribbella italica]MBB5840575.1 ubiquinone/menaquinone biosynthesis C-methylase UbiE [Kribbella italica]
MTGNNLQHPRFARAFARLVCSMDRRGGTAHRRELLTGLSGRVIEVGAGTGANFAHYPATVTEVVAVEPDDHLRSLALQAAHNADVTVHVVAGDAEHLPTDGGDFDAAVMSLVLCSVPDQTTALAEAHRALRPGGQLRYYEHVRSTNHLIAALEDAITPLWSRAAGGCHPNRDTTAAIQAAGLDIEDHRRFGFTGLAHVLGKATRQ